MQPVTASASVLSSLRRKINLFKCKVHPHLRHKYENNFLPDAVQYAGSWLIKMWLRPTWIFTFNQTKAFPTIFLLEKEKLREACLICICKSGQYNMYSLFIITSVQSEANFSIQGSPTAELSAFARPLLKTIVKWRKNHFSMHNWAYLGVKNLCRVNWKVVCVHACVWVCVCMMSSKLKWIKFNERADLMSTPGLRTLIAIIR